MARVITLTDLDAATAVDCGSVVKVTGTDEEGMRVTFAGDTRMVVPILEALIMDEEFEIPVEVEEYQILAVRPVEAP